MRASGFADWGLEIRFSLVLGFRIWDLAWLRCSRNHTERYGTFAAVVIVVASVITASTKATSNLTLNPKP